MASIGLGMATGRALWEQARRTQEENERFLMGRNLYEQQLQLQELQTQQQITEQETSTQASAILEKYRKRIQAGDTEAFAKFLADMSPEEDDVYVVQGNEIMKGYKSPDGEIVWEGVVMDTTGFSGPALLSAAYQHVETTSQLVAGYRTAAAAAAETLNEYQFESFKTDEKIRYAQAESAINLNAALAQNALSGGGKTASFEDIRNTVLLSRNYTIGKVDGVEQIYDMATGQPITAEELSSVNAEIYATYEQARKTGVAPSDIVGGTWGTRLLGSQGSSPAPLTPEQQEQLAREKLDASLIESGYGPGSPLNTGAVQSLQRDFSGWLNNLHDTNQYDVLSSKGEIPSDLSQSDWVSAGKPLTDGTFIGIPEGAVLYPQLTTNESARRRVAQRNQAIAGSSGTIAPSSLDSLRNWNIPGMPNTQNFTNPNIVITPGF